MKIEVVFALPQRQELILLTVDDGTTVAAAIAQSGVAEKFPDVDISSCQAGIWGNPVGREHLLQEGDRVELYRPLSMDPREARRKLAAIGRSMGRANDGEPKDSD
ncbi:MAG: RnfH family protein [Woeseia sp.]